MADSSEGDSPVDRTGCRRGSTSSQETIATATTQQKKWRVQVTHHFTIWRHARPFPYSVICKLHPPGIRINSAIHHLRSGTLSILTTILNKPTHQGLQMQGHQDRQEISQLSQQIMGPLGWQIMGHHSRHCMRHQSHQSFPTRTNLLTRGNRSFTM